MKRGRETFRGRLLASESWDSPARAHYEQAVKALVAHALTTTQRWVFILLSLVLASSAVLFVWLAATQTQVPTLARMLFVEAALFAVALVVYLVTVLKRGVFHRRNMPTFVAGVMWVFALVLSIHFVALIPWVNNINVALFFLGIAMIVVAGTGLQLIRVCVEQSELNTHERLLEMLYRLSSGQPDSGRRDN
jgi:NADH:ubiquinone oxidoreductase subunit 3 (subunit A)